MRKENRKILSSLLSFLTIVAETNIMITEMEDTILKASINNWVINTMNITEVSEDLRYLIQSNIIVATTRHKVQ